MAGAQIPVPEAVDAGKDDSPPSVVLLRHTTRAGTDAAETAAQLQFTSEPPIQIDSSSAEGTDEMDQGEEVKPRRVGAKIQAS